MAEGPINFEILAIFLLLLFYTFASVYIKKWNLKFIHQTGIAILFGLLMGYVLYRYDVTVNFDETLFFYFLLPPIIFAAGYNMKRRRFFRNLGYIGLYGILGTVLSFVIIGVLTYHFSDLGYVVNIHGSVEKLSINEALALGSVLAASDVVAVLTIINETQQPKLHSILFGEGIINDAIAIILFRTSKQVDFSHLSASICA